MERKFKEVSESVSKQIHALRKEIQSESPIKARLNAALIGPILLYLARREEMRLAKGRTYEPPTIVERTNWASA